MATTARPNLLLEGPAHITSAIVRALAPHLKTPIALFDAQPRFDRPATLILDDATRLTVLAQQRLLEWLDDRGERMQVIATAPRPLFAAVERGAFLPALYYRLNVLRLRCGPTP